MFEVPRSHWNVERKHRAPNIERPTSNVDGATAPPPVLALALFPSLPLTLAVEAPSAPATQPATAPASAPAEALKSKDGKLLPTPDELGKLVGDAKAGQAIFRDVKGANCIQCHQLAGEGGDVGPPLTTIGQKLSKAQLHESILYPNAGILMGFENWMVKTKDGEIHTGILAEDTADHVTLKDVQGKYADFPLEEVASKKQQKVSIMPEGLNGSMTQQELVDLVEFLSTLRNAE